MREGQINGVPAAGGERPVIADQVQEVHALLGWVILAMAGLHAEAALAHRYLWRDGVLGRMLPSG